MSNDVPSPNAAHDAASVEVSFDQRPLAGEWVSSERHARPGGACAALGDEIDAARSVSRFVFELMAWRAHLDHVDRLSRAVARPTTQQSALARLQSITGLGIVGSGCKGSRGVWIGEGPVDALIDAAEASTTRALVDDRDAGWRARLDAMPERLAIVAAWIRDETRGESPPKQRANDPVGYVLEFTRPARRVTGLSLAEIVGLSTAEAKQRARWEAKMAAGDGSMAREGMRERGEALLVECARAWFRS